MENINAQRNSRTQRRNALFQSPFSSKDAKLGGFGKYVTNSDEDELSSGDAMTRASIDILNAPVATIPLINQTIGSAIAQKDELISMGDARLTSTRDKNLAEFLGVLLRSVPVSSRYSIYSHLSSLINRPKVRGIVNIADVLTHIIPLGDEAVVNAVRAMTFASLFGIFDSKVHAQGDKDVANDQVISGDVISIGGVKIKRKQSEFETESNVNYPQRVMEWAAIDADILKTQGALLMKMLATVYPNNTALATVVKELEDDLTQLAYFTSELSKGNAALGDVEDVAIGGFFKKLKSLGQKIVKIALPIAEQVGQFIPAVKLAVEAAKAGANLLSPIANKLDKTLSNLDSYGETVRGSKEIPMLSPSIQDAVDVIKSLVKSNPDSSYAQHLLREYDNNPSFRNSADVLGTILSSAQYKQNPNYYRAFNGEPQMMRYVTTGDIMTTVSQYVDEFLSWDKVKSFFANLGFASPVMGLAQFIVHLVASDPKVSAKMKLSPAELNSIKKIAANNPLPAKASLSGDPSVMPPSQEFNNNTLSLVGTSRTPTLFLSQGDVDDSRLRDTYHTDLARSYVLGDVYGIGSPVTTGMAPILMGIFALLKWLGVQVLISMVVDKIGIPIIKWASSKLGFNVSTPSATLPASQDKNSAELPPLEDKNGGNNLPPLPSPGNNTHALPSLPISSSDGLPNKVEDIKLGAVALPKLGSSENESGSDEIPSGGEEVTDADANLLNAIFHIKNVPDENSDSGKYPVLVLPNADRNVLVALIDAGKKIGSDLDRESIVTGDARSYYEVSNATVIGSGVMSSLMRNDVVSQGDVDNFIGDLIQMESLRGDPLARVIDAHIADVNQNVAIGGVASALTKFGTLFVMKNARYGAGIANLIGKGVGKMSPSVALAWYRFLRSKAGGVVMQLLPAAVVASIVGLATVAYKKISGNKSAELPTAENDIPQTLSGVMLSIS